MTAIPSTQIVDQAAASDGKPQIAIISNEPTPYRLHVLNRIADELPDVRVHNIFTHTISTASMPWQMKLDEKINPVFFAEHHLDFGKQSLLKGIRLFRAIRDYLVQNKIRLIVLLGYNDITRLALIRWARRAGIPLLLTGDSNVFAEGRVSGLRRIIKRCYLKYVLNRVAGLMPMGTCGRAFFRIYHQHDLPEFLFPYEPDYEAFAKPPVEDLQAFAKKHGWSPDRHRLLYCGRLVQVKRVDLLIAAFARVADQILDWDLIIAGDGELRKSLEQSLPEALRSRVQWLGFIQFHETALTYHSCDVLVHPSEYEPWGLVINEAVASGLAVISTSVVGAAIELVRHGTNGLLVQPGSAAALASAILEMTSNNNFLTMRDRSADILEMWRRAADPVDGLRNALEFFQLFSSPNHVARPIIGRK